jgi:hypothetical protein
MQEKWVYIGATVVGGWAATHLIRARHRARRHTAGFMNDDAGAGHLSIGEMARRVVEDAMAARAYGRRTGR